MALLDAMLLDHGTASLPEASAAVMACRSRAEGGSSEVGKQVRRPGVNHVFCYGPEHGCECKSGFRRCSQTASVVSGMCSRDDKGGFQQSLDTSPCAKGLT